MGIVVFMTMQAVFRRK